MSDKVTRQRPQTTTFSKRGPSAYQPNALPLGQTGSHLCTIDKNPSYCSSYRFSHCVYSYRKQPQISPFTFHHNVRTISERNAVQIRYRLPTGRIVLHICTRPSRDRASAEEGEISILIKRGNKKFHDSHSAQVQCVPSEIGTPHHHHPRPHHHHPTSLPTPPRSLPNSLAI